MSSERSAVDRDSVLASLRALGRRQSTAAVLFHSVLAERVGLSAVEEKTLELVLRHEGVTPRELARTTGLAPASVTGLLDRLEAKALVRRERDPQDGRRVRVVPDPEQVAAIGAHFSGLMQALDEVYAQYSTADLELIAGYVERTTVAQELAAQELGGTRVGDDPPGPA